MLRQGDIGAHPELLPKGSWAGPVHLASQPGSETHCGSHQHGNQQLLQTSTHHHPVDHLREGREQLPRGATTQDWQLSVDLVKQLKFPRHIVTTTLRPDILLVSEVTKNTVMLELTVQWEDRLEKAHERKKTSMKNWSSTATSRAGRQGVCPSRLSAEVLHGNCSTKP